MPRRAASSLADPRRLPVALLSGACLLLVLLLLPLLAGCGSAASGTASALKKEANLLQGRGELSQAAGLLAEAEPAFENSGDQESAGECRERRQDIEIIVGTYPLTADQAIEQVLAAYPGIDRARLETLVADKSTETLWYDGELHYFGDVAANLGYRNLDLFQSVKANTDAYGAIYQKILPFVEASRQADPQQPYQDWVEYRFTQKLSVARDKLPTNGLLKIWFPLPIEGGPQRNVNVHSVSPTTYLKYPASTNDDIGLLYMEVPLEQLTGDLDVSIEYGFEHASQYFKVDPQKIGRYDTNSPLYKQYTASRGNTAITPAIREKAREITAGEGNAYLAARMIYDYVVQHITYSYMPHMALYPRGVPESVYVHEHGYGDCGAQSMYFVALCRAVGIPARCTGGFQIFGGTPSGHFWAEIYLPNYGWMPVDTSAAQMVDYLPGKSLAEIEAFHDFFFGSQDSMRQVVQRETDTELIPAADEKVLLPMAIQLPAALCPTMQEIPGVVMMEGWTIE